MESRLLFVQPVNSGDTLADIRSAIHQVAESWQCRAIMFVGTFHSEEDLSESTNGYISTNASPPSLSTSDLDLPTTSEVTASYERRKVGDRIVLMTANYPTNDDLAAVRVLMNEYGASGDAKAVVVVNDHLGEFSCLAASVSHGTVYSIMPDIMEETRKEIYARNVNSEPRIASIYESKAEKADPVGADAVIFIDPREGDYEQYLRHLKQGGIALMVSTNGTAPFIHNEMMSRAKQSTNSVFYIVRDILRNQ